MMHWRRHPQKVAGLVLVAPALPAKPDAFRRAMTAGQQLQSLARLALLRSDTAGGQPMLTTPSVHHSPDAIASAAEGVPELGRGKFLS